MKLHKSDTYQHMASIRKIQSVNETWMTRVTMTTSLAALHGIGLAGISNVPQQHSAVQKRPS